MRYAFLTFLLTACLGFWGELEAQTDSILGLIGGYEITFRFPREERRRSQNSLVAKADHIRTFVQELQAIEEGRFEVVPTGLGQSVYENVWVRDRTTNALFLIYIDNQSIEITTPPLQEGEVQEVLAPLFQTADRLHKKDNYPPHILKKQEITSVQQSLEKLRARIEEAKQAGNPSQVEGLEKELDQQRAKLVKLGQELKEIENKLFSPEFKAPLMDLYQNWLPDTGGGHIHLDNRPFKASPDSFVNLLVMFHNDPLLQEFFQPASGEFNIFHRGLQKEFAAAVDEYWKIPNPNWKDVERLFAPLLNTKPGSSVRMLENTFEVRFFKTHLSSHHAKLALKAMNHIWKKASQDQNLRPIHWTPEEYFHQIDHRRADELISAFMTRYDLSPAQYAYYIEDYKKLRKTYMENLTQESGLNELEGIFFEITPVERKALMLKALGELKIIGQNMDDPHQSGSLERYNAFFHALGNYKWYEDPDVLAAYIEVLQTDHPFSLQMSLRRLFDIPEWWKNQQILENVLRIFRSSNRSNAGYLWKLLNHSGGWRNILPLKELVLDLIKTRDESSLTFLFQEVLPGNWQGVSELEKLVVSTLSNRHSPPSLLAKALPLLKEVPNWYRNQHLRLYVTRALNDKKDSTGAVKGAAIELLATIDWPVNYPFKKRVMESIRDSRSKVRKAAWKLLGELKRSLYPEVVQIAGEIIRSETNGTFLSDTLEGLRQHWATTQALRPHLYFLLDHSDSKLVFDGLQVLYDFEWWQDLEVVKRVEALASHQDPLLTSILKSHLRTLKLMRKGTHFPESYAIHYLSENNCPFDEVEHLRVDVLPSSSEDKTIELLKNQICHRPQ